MSVYFAQVGLTRAAGPAFSRELSEHTRAWVSAYVAGPRVVPAARVRRWALANGIAVSERGAIPRRVRLAYEAAHASP